LELRRLGLGVETLKRTAREAIDLETSAGR